MEYALSKVLQDAGFPQQPKIDISGIDGPFYGSFYYLTKQGNYEVARNFLNEREYRAYMGLSEYELTKSPSLDELVEECANWAMTHGEGMEAYRMEISGGQVEKASAWVARLSQTSFGEWNAEGNSEDIKKTLAKLWLELQKVDKKIQVCCANVDKDEYGLSLICAREAGHLGKHEAFTV